MEEGAHQFKSVANQAQAAVVINLVFPSSQLSALMRGQTDTFLVFIHSVPQLFRESGQSWDWGELDCTAQLITQHQIEIKTNDVNINLPLLTIRTQHSVR